MAVIQSYGALQRSGTNTAPVPARSSSFDALTCATYAAMYRTQPWVRIVVDYLARNVAQVGLHVYRRVSDTDRERLTDHELAQWLAKPNPYTTTYKLIETLMQDLGIYGMGFWLKVRLPERIGLVRLAPESLMPYGEMGLPTAYDWIRADYSVVSLNPRDVVAFRYFNPENPLLALSPLETLRQILLEDSASSAYRRAFWQNAARLEGVISRPAGAPKWSPEQKQSFREQWQARYAGAPGQTAVLEDGMTFTATTYSARESEFISARKLTREEVVASYHVPLPMVGILDHATFSNIREQHKNLYQDSLGPTFEWLQQEIESQLLIECTDQENVYVEANIADKMKGSFEEQSAALRSAIGRPWMTPNEGRARVNLPAIEDPEADQLAMPLNMETSGLSEPVVNFARPALIPSIRATWDRQRDRLDKFDPTERARAFDVDRWDRELAADLEACYRKAGAPRETAAHAAFTLARTINADTLQLLVSHEEAFSDSREAALYV